MDENKLIEKYLKIMRPHITQINIKKVWIEHDNLYGWKACYLYDGFYDNEMGYRYLGAFDREQAIKNMEIALQ